MHFNFIRFFFFFYVFYPTFSCLNVDQASHMWLLIGTSFAWLRSLVIIPASIVNKKNSLYHNELLQMTWGKENIFTQSRVVKMIGEKSRNDWKNLDLITLLNFNLFKHCSFFLLSNDMHRRIWMTGNDGEFIWMTGMP